MAKLSDLHKHYRPGVKLLCEVCGDEYSANPGDYFDKATDHEFKCCNHVPMALVRKTVSYERLA